MKSERRQPTSRPAAAATQDRTVAALPLIVEGIPEPGLELNPGPPTKPRPAATVMLLRGGRRSLKVLLVKRNPAARFMGGAWVFPGGTVKATDGDGEAGLRMAATRELHEEAGISLAPDAELVTFARWITPPEVKIRFDTWFYLTHAPARSKPSVDGEEVVDWGWYAPAAALEANATATVHLAFPTIRQLQQLSVFASATALIEHARRTKVTPVEPRLQLDGETARIVLPGETAERQPS
jgi:8-oxo-dGTP pyrophosphatase MutT (NUDIX family)